MMSTFRGQLPIKCKLKLQVTKLHFRPGYACDPRSGAVGLVCQKPTYAVCPGASEPHGARDAIQ